MTQAAERLKQGQLVAFATETVYGLGADASNPEALAALYQLKGRPSEHPVIVHLASADLMPLWASHVPKEAWKLAQAFWPGPLTLLLPKHPNVLAAVTGGKPTVGLRVPNHPVALALLKAFGGGLAAPSANRFGRISPTTAAHVYSEFGESLPILNGGPCKVGLESTIVDLSQPGQITIVRPGAITQAQLETCLNQSVKTLCLQAKSAKTSLAPGTLLKHYAPQTPTRLVSTKKLAQAADFQGVGVVSFHPAPAGITASQWVQLPNQATAYAQQLYATLRYLDEQVLSQLWVESPPQTPEWQAVTDRLTRACAS